MLHFTSPLIAATPATLDDFADALSDAKPPPALEALTGDQALLAHVQALASSGEPESVALARTCANILAKGNVPGAAQWAAGAIATNPQKHITVDESIRLSILIDHLADLCNEDDTMSQNLPRELMEAIARDCPTPLGRVTAAEYLADQASPPASADAVPDPVPLLTTSQALDSAADAIFAAPQGHLGLDSLAILKSPEEFFDHYLHIKAKLLAAPTTQAIQGIIDDLLQRVRTAEDADKSPDAQTVLTAFAAQLRDIRSQAPRKADALVEERQLKDATRAILAAADREDPKALQPLVDAAIHPGAHLRDQIGGIKGTQRVWLEYAVMEEPDDPASPTRLIQLFLGIADEAQKTTSAKVAATFTKTGDQWVLQSGLRLTGK